jgi:Ras GTPase-activating-like protein IQGAP2/3
MSADLGSSVEDSSVLSSSSVTSPSLDSPTVSSPELIRSPSQASRPALQRLRTLVKLASVVNNFTTAVQPRNDPVWVEERECLILVLKARMMLRDMIENRLRQERYEEGRLSVFEIQNLLKNQKEDVETDWIAEIQELKRNIVAEVRKNHQLERDLTKLDKRIALLIKHRSNIKELLAATNQKKAKVVKKEGEQPLHLDAKRLEVYQHLFYLLQTEPHYLAKLVTLVQPDKMEQFLETVILTLFGDAFSPREEFLILSLFNLAIGQEMNAMKSVGDLLSVDSVVPKMIIAYNHRKQGHDFLKQIIAPVLDSVTNIVELNLELNAVQVYQAMITDVEIQTGVKSEYNRDLKEEQILEDPQVKSILKARIEKCISICNMFFDGIISSLNRLPYGIRWICKQIHHTAKQKWNSSADEIGKVIGYFVYYRFVNLAIVTPDSFDFVGKELTITARRNLVVVAKVLQNLFSLNLFQNQGGERWMLPLNEWISQKTAAVRKYFEELIKVEDPTEYLKVDKYNELTLKINPVIVISLSEISQTHQLIEENVSALRLKDKDDPLEIIVKELGHPVEVSEENDREIQLTLVNRFKEKLADEEISSTHMVLTETKELVISVFRLIPQQNNKDVGALDDLIGILDSAKLYGKENHQPQLVNNVEKILSNLKVLENAKTIRGKDDNYEGFLRAIALEVTNRQIVKEQQRKERLRLTNALRDLRKHGAYLSDQISQFNNYLKDVLSHYGPRDTNKRTKPIKFSYKDLKKKGIIVASEVPKIGQKTTTFLISSESPGVFEVEARMAGKTADTIILELDDLLEKSHSNIQHLKLEYVTLHVNLTLHLLNRYFLKKVK